WSAPPPRPPGPAADSRCPPRPGRSPRCSSPWACWMRPGPCRRRTPPGGHRGRRRTRRRGRAHRARRRVADGAGEAAHASRMPHGGPVRDVDTMTRIMGAVDTEAVTDQASDFDDALRARLTDAVDVARTAVEEFASDGVGEHLDAIVEAPFTTTHRFVSELPGYRGWHWACVLALVPGGEVTIDEISLLPGEGAVVAPEWVPWEKRI